MGVTPAWRTLYDERQTTAEFATTLIGPGQRVVVGGSNAEPEALVDALVARARTAGLRDVEVLTWPGGFASRLVDPELVGRLNLTLSVPNRHTAEALRSGQASYVPSHVHRQLRRVVDGDVALDWVLAMVSPPDEQGYVSLGTSVINLGAACRATAGIIAEVNPHMPRTAGASTIHVSRIAAFVRTDRPLRELPASPISAEDQAIAAHIKGLVPNGATLQCGIGALPDAVMSTLADHRSLGVHTGIVGDWLVDLAESGALRQDRPVVTGSVMGTARLYAHVDANEAVELHDGLVTHDWARIGSHDDFVSINSVLEMDLLGQANAETTDRGTVAGVGGLNDFIRGAQLSRGGRSILVLRSTARGGHVSRIVPRLRPGAPVSVTRADVQWVVTEHGAVDLEGLDERARAEALIGIADPAHRESLRRHVSSSTKGTS